MLETDDGWYGNLHANTYAKLTNYKTIKSALKYLKLRQYVIAVAFIMKLHIRPTGWMMMDDDLAPLDDKKDKMRKERIAHADMKKIIFMEWSGHHLYNMIIIMLRIFQLIHRASTSLTKKKRL